MTRIPTPAYHLSKYKGKIITREMFIGRGYCHVKDGNVIDDEIPHVEELSWEEGKGSDNDITCKKVKEYIARTLDDYSNDGVEYWIKGLPSNPEDVCGNEVYMVIYIEVKPVANGFEIADFLTFARWVENNCWVSIPGVATMDSSFNEMILLPPEHIKEVESLIAGRFIPENFTFIGKPMPENKEVFYPNPAYSLANNSGWRNVYWHLSINVDNNDIIEGIEFSTYEREVSMFQRPYLMPDDITDAFDAALMIVDQYTDKEWNAIKNM